jgi:DNA invertase Pin-like site-specific DNA recombinase
VWKLSRFARNREDSIIYKSLLRKQGVQVISINEPVDDSAAGKLLEGMIEVIDEFYSRNLAEDVLRGMKENAEKGFSNGGPTPFGYRRIKINVGNIQKSKLEPDEAEMPVVRRMFQMALAGHGSKNIAKALNRDGFKTRAGKHWSSTIINKILRNEVYTGTLVWTGKNGEDIRCHEAHPELVSRADFNKVQQLLVDRRPRVRHPRTVNSQYILSSLLHCTRCGATMIGASAKSGDYHYYKCNNHFRVTGHQRQRCSAIWNRRTGEHTRALA